MTSSPEPKPKTASTTNTLVVDTNVVLDLWVFSDPSTEGVAAAVQSAAWVWLGTPAMRDELERVLTYDRIAAHLVVHRTTPAQVLALYDTAVQQVAAAPQCSAICKDADDQKFIDLAVQHGAVLLSKDNAVLALSKRLIQLGVAAMTAQAFVA